MNVRAEALREIARRIFEAAGSASDEAQTVAARLVESNLCGHDSHGIIRVHQYVTSVRAGMTHPNRAARVVSETEAVAVLDGGRGYGQVVAEQALRIAIDKARRHGVAMVALRNAAHVGRLADWALLATDAGMAAIILCNAAGVPPIVVPHGGRDARASTNPMAIALPREGEEPLVLDFATSGIAEGKVRVAHHKGTLVPPECMLDADGQPTRDPGALYREPRGALLPFGGDVAGHKGGGLSLMCDLLAGAFTGGRCNHPVAPDDPHFANNLIAVVLAPAVYGVGETLAGEVREFCDYVRSSRPRREGGEVLLPGEPELRSKAERQRSGVPVSDATWHQLMEAAELVGLARADLEALTR